MMDKTTFKICEAVALGLTRYYLETWKPIDLTPEDKVMASKIIPTLPDGWMQGADNLPWSCMNKNKKQKKTLTETR